MRRHLYWALLLGTIIICLVLDAERDRMGVRSDRRKARAWSTYPEPPEYYRALRMYHQQIAGIAAERDRSYAADYLRGQARNRKARRNLEKHATHLLEELRAAARRSPDGKLEVSHNEFCDDENPGCLALRADSATSARVFGVLLKEDLVDPAQFVQTLRENGGGDSPLFDPAWVPVLQGIVERQTPKAWKPAAAWLYRLGVSRKQYRPWLEDWALHGDLLSAETLLFDENPKTGQLRALKSAENTSLLLRLSDQPGHPEVLALCVAYAAKTGRPELAESVAADVLLRPYLLPFLGTPPFDVETRREEDADAELGCAKEEILMTLFHDVRTDGAFKMVYDRANYLQVIASQPDLMIQIDYTCRGGDSEREQAKGLLWEVTHADE